VLHVEVTTTVQAPRETVAAVYAEYTSWPPISVVRLVRREGSTLVLDRSGPSPVAPALASAVRSS
jgi:hypothetical protein